MSSKIRTIATACLFTLALTSCHAQKTTNEPAYAAANDAALQQMLPEQNEDEQVVSHMAYVLSYNNRHEQASWVAYMLNRERANGQRKRINNFREDPAVASGSARHWDYKHSGYSRGHLAPAGDMKWDSIAMDESFLMSNMSPQEHSFNDGVWNKLENLIRQWARQYDTLYIITGPVITDRDTLAIGQTCSITVPSAFYKVIYAPATGQGIGFIVPHQQRNLPLQTFAVSIDSVEAATGLNFFANLPNAETIEKTLCINCWKFNNKQ